MLAVVSCNTTTFLKGPNWPHCFCTLSKVWLLLILHGKIKSYCLTVSILDSMFNYLKYK